MTRGAYQEVQKFVDSVNKIHLKTKVSVEGIEGGKPVDQWVQIGLQPIQLWSMNFPKEYKDMVLTTLFNGNDGSFVPHQKKFNKYAKLLQFILGVDSLGEYKTDLRLNEVYTANVQKIAIGIKEDYTKEDGTEGI